MQQGFVIRIVEGIRYYSCLALEEVKSFRHGFSTRLVNAFADNSNTFNLSNEPWNGPGLIDSNRRRFLGALQLQDGHLATLRQIHSDRVHIIKDLSDGWNSFEGDALVTQLAGLALAVEVADCFPILMADPVTEVIAAVHSGWRGMLAHIGLKAVQEMERNFGVDPRNLIVAVGPAIRSCCYEVGPEVAERFHGEFPGIPLTHPSKLGSRKFYLDLGRALGADFDCAGIKPQNRYDLGLCTCCNSTQFFSYRAEGKNTGRMMAIIARLAAQE